MDDRLAAEAGPVPRAAPEVAGAVHVRAVAPDDVVDLRHRVLRAGLPRDTAIFEGDAEPTTVHFAAFDADERIVGCVTILRRPRPAATRLPGDLVPPDSASPGVAAPTAVASLAWQLRGMAVDPALQRGGVGGRLLAAVDVHVAAHADASLWCNARAVAVPFYARHGWRVVSDEFVIPTAGPHRVMVK